MTVNGPLAREPAPAEQPTPRAELRIRVSRARARDTAKGRVPPDQASYMIMTRGVLGCVVTGTAGMVLTLCVAPKLPGLAVAELIVTVTAVFIIAAGRRSRAATGPAAEPGRPVTPAGSSRARPDSGAEEGSTGS